MTTVLGREEIEAILPHRPPFLLIDEVVELEPGERVVARKTVRPDEWYLSGHFPGRPVMPGVLIVEAMAQTGAVAVLSQERLPELTGVAARACADAIEAVGDVRTELKFPNDVLVAGRKVAGILAEAREDRVVAGIGVNVNIAEDDLPTGLDTPATSLLVETGREIDRVELLVELLVRLERRYGAWLTA